MKIKASLGFLCSNLILQSATITSVECYDALVVSITRTP